MRLAARFRKFDVTLDLFNLFDRRDETNTDPVYSGGAIHPIEGGRSEDLVFLRSEDPDSQTSFASQRSPGFQTGTAFQAPFSAVLGIHRSF